LFSVIGYRLSVISYQSAVFRNQCGSWQWAVAVGSGRSLVI